VPPPFRASTSSGFGGGANGAAVLVESSSPEKLVAQCGKNRNGKNATVALHIAESGASLPKARWLRA
jgi:hypothetical protein